MKYEVRGFRSLASGLKELERFVRNGEHLQTGRPFQQLGGMRSREALANWLLCAVMINVAGRQFGFTSDPTGGDGIIRDQATEDTWPTEHVAVPNLPQGIAKPIEELVLDQIRAKVGKGGAAYASGKTLLVFIAAGGGHWHPNKLARTLPDPLLFDTVWTMGLEGVDAGAYVYGVANLRPGSVNSAVWRVRINPSFESWAVERLQ